MNVHHAINNILVVIFTSPVTRDTKVAILYIANLYLSNNTGKRYWLVVVLFNVALNTFYLRLYGVGHMVKDHSDSE